MILLQNHIKLTKNETTAQNLVNLYNNTKTIENLFTNEALTPMVTQQAQQNFLP